MEVIIGFLRDAAKIMFGSVIVAFFVPTLGGQVTWLGFGGGIIATAVCLMLAIILSKKKKLS